MIGDTTAYLRWPEHGRRRGKVVHNVTEPEAHELMDAVMSELSVRGTRYTVAEFGAVYLKDVRLAPSDETSVRSRFRRYIEAMPIGRIRIHDLRPRHVKAWLASLRRMPNIGQQSERHCANLLSAICREAVERELMASNPVRAVRKPPVPQSRRALVLTSEQIERLAYDETLDVVGATVLLQLVGSLLRPGELRGLEIADARDGRFDVWRSDRFRETTKGGEYRAVEIFGWGAFALERWRRIRPTLEIKRVDIAKSPWLYPVPRSWFKTRGRLGKVLKAIGADGFHAHDMRGTGATHLLSGTWGPPWEIAAVAALIGDSVETARKAYAHVLPTRHRELGRRTRVGHGAIGSGGKGEGFSARLAEFESATPGFGGHALHLAFRGDGSPDVPSLSSLATRYLQAVRDDDPHAHDRGVELAAAVLRAEAQLREGEEVA